MSDMELYIKLKSLPEPLKKEALNFIDYLKSKLSQPQPTSNREAGLAKGLIEMADDFDEPLEDFQEYME